MGRCSVAPDHHSPRKTAGFSAPGEDGSMGDHKQKGRQMRVTIDDLAANDLLLKAFTGTETIFRFSHGGRDRTFTTYRAEIVPEAWRLRRNLISGPPAPPRRSPVPGPSQRLLGARPRAPSHVSSPQVASEPDPQSPDRLHASPSQPPSGPFLPRMASFKTTSSPHRRSRPTPNPCPSKSNFPFLSWAAQRTHQHRKERKDGTNRILGE